MNLTKQALNYPDGEELIPSTMDSGKAKPQPTEMGEAKCVCLLSTYGSRGDVEPMVGLAAQFDTVAAVAEGCDALVATGVMPAGVWLCPSMRW